MSETQFLECNALLAVMSDNTDEALRILDDMLPGERRALMEACNRLSDLADDSTRCDACGKPTDGLSSVSSWNVRTGKTTWLHRTCRDARDKERASAFA